MANPTTVQDILTDSLVDSGAFAAGMPPPASAINKAHRQLNWLLAQWNRKRYLIYRLQDLHVVATGAQTYSIGPSGADITIANRPDKLEAAFMRQSNVSPSTPLDYPLRLIDSYEDYSTISIKKLATWTQWLFYDPTWPNGTLYPWPIMQAGFELHVITKAVLTSYATIAELVALPTEYEYALYQILKVRFRALYRLPPDPVDIGLAKDALNLIRGANSQIRSMVMPRALRTRRSQYNIYSDDNS